ncbi:MAG: FAD-dependent oxidoreductase [Pseudomonadales bacterium]|jgi:NADPH-dependent glutamate synthase beta subunit-like oxidoreductase/NAD(P)H-flavin reductase|nr:FAD-dependent oxidoreductase [Pseudomonadales bacterium]MCP5321777.1 FAD-dependent oxidoreductase [Pseudomonadales bacterium]
MLKLAHDLEFTDLHRRAGLERVDAAFLAHVAAVDAPLHAALLGARAHPEALAPKAESELLIALAPHLEDFTARLFGIEAEAAQLAAAHHELAPVFSVKRLFVQRVALLKVKPEQLAGFDPDAAERELLGETFSELGFAQRVSAWQCDEAANAERLALAARYAAWAAGTDAGRARHAGGVLFKTPAKLDYQNLVPIATRETLGFTRHSIDHLRRREGFALTDPGTDLYGALDEANYCIWCHNQGKDSCSHGFRDKAPKGSDPARAPFRKSVLGVTLTGCPLEEKISEFHFVKTRGESIAALAMIVIDNPMVAGTGHRICNDCMKACIYQKQQPVDIPQAETRTVKDVLELPWGFEIYSLLTRWNPLNLRRPLPLADSGRKVLVVGLGPSGYTLAHHLMNDGHTVVGIDGVKIEPLSATLSGVDMQGRRVPFAPVRNVSELFEPLDARVMAGFGGVAEYGITVRWDKNFLKILRLLVERRAEFAMFGGVRFGGTVTPEDAWDMGFDHVALCVGAGGPTVLNIPNGLRRGVRAASDFLMALQLTGAAKTDSIANMQLRLPVVVIGGGLTAIDTATESMAYYAVQIEKFLVRYESLTEEIGEDAIRANWDDYEREIAEEFLAHARAIRQERDAAAAAGRAPRVIEMLRHWGGVTVAYRRRLIDSPAYTLNHEEIDKALEEGIWFAEGMSPVAVDVDHYGATRGIRLRNATTGTEHWFPARTVFVAAGTQPNTVLAREHPERYLLDGKYFCPVDENGTPVKAEQAFGKPDTPHVLLSRRADGRFMSYFGDVHPSWVGNVVRAMASAKQGYPTVSRVLAQRAPASPLSREEFFTGLAAQLLATVHRVERLTPNIVEVTLHAPLAARQFRPGQFYRLQNFETLAPVVHGTRLQMEGLAMTGASVDPERGLVSVIALEMGGSSSLCAMLQPGEPVILMGPTGSPTHITGNETVVLCGGGLGNAVLFSIGAAMRAAGSRVLYFAGYKKVQDRYKVAEIENAADVIVWCCDEAPGFAPGRAQDRTFIGNIVQAMDAYAEGRLGECTIRLDDADRIIAIGSDRMMAGVARARHEILKPHLKPHHFAIGSINSPMQCMMKEICAQCLQPHRDPITKETSYVFSCFNQDQPLDCVDWKVLNERLKQNSLAEKLTARWLERRIAELDNKT